MSQSVQLKMLRKVVLDCVECATVRFRTCLYTYYITNKKAGLMNAFLFKQVGVSDPMTNLGLK